MATIQSIPSIDQFLQTFSGVLQTDEDKYSILVGIENLLYSTLQVLDCYAEDLVMVNLDCKDEQLSVYIVIGQDYTSGKSGRRVDRVEYMTTLRTLVTLCDIDIEMNSSYYSLENQPEGSIPGFRNRSLDKGVIQIRISGMFVKRELKMKQEVFSNNQIPDDIPGTNISELSLSKRKQTNERYMSLCCIFPMVKYCLGSGSDISTAEMKALMERRRRWAVKRGMSIDCSYFDSSESEGEFSRKNSEDFENAERLLEVHEDLLEETGSLFENSTSMIEHCESTIARAGKLDENSGKIVYQSLDTLLPSQVTSVDLEKHVLSRKSSVTWKDNQENATETEEVFEARRNENDDEKEPGILSILDKEIKELEIFTSQAETFSKRFHENERLNFFKEMTAPETSTPSPGSFQTVTSTESHLDMPLTGSSNLQDFKIPLPPLKNKASSMEKLAEHLENQAEDVTKEGTDRKNSVSSDTDSTMKEKKSFFRRGSKTLSLKRNASLKKDITLKMDLSLSRDENVSGDLKKREGLEKSNAEELKPDDGKKSKSIFRRGSKEKYSLSRENTSENMKGKKDEQSLGSVDTESMASAQISGSEPSSPKVSLKRRKSLFKKSKSSGKEKNDENDDNMKPRGEVTRRKSIFKKEKVQSSGLQEEQEKENGKGEENEKKKGEKEKKEKKKEGKEKKGKQSVVREVDILNN